jgi:hypothetical protein
MGALGRFPNRIGGLLLLIIFFHLHRLPDALEALTPWHMPINSWNRVELHCMASGSKWNGSCTATPLGNLTTLSKKSNVLMWASTRG